MTDSSNNSYLPIDSRLEESNGFIDLDFSLLRYKKDDNLIQTFIAKGCYGNALLGFKIELLSEWRETEIANIPSYRSRLSLQSIGDESDRFVQTLAKLYQLELASPKMLPHIQFTAITLGGNPMKLGEGGVRIKIFFEPPDETPDYEERYAEHFLNIDLQRNAVYFNEKDQAYREAILNALTKPLHEVS